MELRLVGKQNAKTVTAFLRMRDEYVENEKFLINLSDIKVCI